MRRSRRASQRAAAAGGGSSSAAPSQVFDGGQVSSGADREPRLRDLDRRHRRRSHGRAIHGDVAAAAPRDGPGGRPGAAQTGRRVHGRENGGSAGLETTGHAESGLAV
ncbi:uncharacterized protein A4U43_C04F33960 [Asparagus officinalis]|uniref:Uncharacterized protein n=1 Tax=Asparagus officinalis TaxID=4686 RepID=A0A5P1F668_ASPOF|nr:uncharacterized protein A4U43_C04F33960 [Asparagus officinalis]